MCVLEERKRVLARALLDGLIVVALKERAIEKKWIGGEILRELVRVMRDRRQRERDDMIKVKMTIESGLHFVFVAEVPGASTTMAWGLRGAGLCFLIFGCENGIGVIMKRDERGIEKERHTHEHARG